MRTSPLRRSGVDHTVLPANTPHLPLPRSSPEGATTEWTVTALADEACCSLIDPVRMKGWVGLVGWSTADVWPTNTKWSSVQLAVRRRTGKVRRSKTSVLPLCYATNRQQNPLSVLKFSFQNPLSCNIKRRRIHCVLILQRVDMSWGFRPALPLAGGFDPGGLCPGGYVRQSTMDWGLLRPARVLYKLFGGV